VGGALGLAALAGFAGRWSWACELLGHFRIQYFWGLLAAAVALAVARYYCRAAAVGALVLLNAGLIVPFYFGGAPAPPRDEAPRLRVLSFNVWAGNHDCQRIIEYVKEVDPDVAVFFEVNGRWARALEGLEERWPHFKIKALDSPFGVALFSRVPLDVARFDYLSNGCPVVVAKARAGDTPVTIFGVHTANPVVPLRAVLRDEQFAALAELVIAEPGPKVVIGDFNITSWSPAFHDLVARTGLRDSRAGFGVQPTFPAAISPLPGIPIDHCLVSPEVTVAKREIGPDVGSDHLPLIVELSLAGE
jgi:endonuclease/exonuclease/phosphatase (EEP) superfamily protein YafD